MTSKTTEELRKHLKDAWPVECMEAHGAAGRMTEEVGVVQGPYDRWYRLFLDDQGDYWYQTMVGTEKGVVTEYEAIFGTRSTLKRA